MADDKGPTGGEPPPELEPKVYVNGKWVPMKDVVRDKRRTPPEPPKKRS
jgi:hypothetical protein